MKAYAMLTTRGQAGYTRCSPWPERCPGEIDAFIAARPVCCCPVRDDGFVVFGFSQA